ncbi:Glycosyltransferase [Melia azedarach]|uniref:Glycosyltransferase n=1 Tax=Melia azedarach TaxID=155640 RepID=A0ACC1X2R1_MELAZ|nr:Glycosyltransferase [Melia azedarach]
MAKKAELVFIPAPAIGHLIPNIEFATRLLDREDRFSVTVLVSSLVGDSSDTAAAYTQLFSASDTRIRFIGLPQINAPFEDFQKSPEKFFTDFIDSHKPYVKEAIIKHLLSDSVPIAGLVLDMFSTSMIDIGNELGVPSYSFFASSAAFLGLVLYLSARGSEEFEESDSETADFFSYLNPVPHRVLPSFCFNKNGGYTTFQNIGKRFKEMKGIFVNTYKELEFHAVESLMKHDHIPPVYTVGPVIDFASRIQTQPSGVGTKRDEIIKWLEDQPPSSVVFLCFGSGGSFREEQLREIAFALEQTGRRFLWSVRKPPPADKFERASDYEGLDEILPRGFLERTKGKGYLCGWAPQKEVLAHRAIGGFVSHCGWNSILESLWFGVPVVTWPMYAEQQINAFQMVKDLGLAVEMRLDYRKGGGELVQADEIARAVECVMDGGDEVRKRVKEASKKSRLALMNGGSSFDAYGRLIEDVLANMR